MVELDNVPVEGLDGDLERDFVSDCNDVIHFKLVRRSSDIESEENEFLPDMSHQVFGKTEKIFGYKDLKINLFYTAGWLHTYMNVSFEEKIDPSVIGLPADDVVDILSKFLSHEYMENIDSFVNILKEESTFKPSGTLIHKFNERLSDDDNGGTFEIYHVHISNTSSNFFEGYYQRLQRFIIWYIDGASYVDINDDKWNFFLLYEKYENENNDHCYGIVGLTTVYEYYAYPQNIRPRISQLLVLPPFQNCGMAVHLLESIYRFYATSSVVDITVEDPTDNCQSIRDYVDLCRCERLNIFNEENLKNGFTKDMEVKLRKEFKIHKKQSRRLFEIMLLKTINKADEEQYKKYRIMVKNRLNAPFLRMNSSTRRRMNQTLKPDEVECANVFQKPEIRLITLAKMYDELEEQYERVLSRYENRTN